jgi:hypothetical protein
VIIWPRRIAVLGVLLILVAACAGDGDEPATLPDVTPVGEAAPATTPTPTPTVEPPVQPSNAHEYTAEGVEAFTRYAIDVINYASATNDVSSLQRIMTINCRTCSRAVESLKALAQSGGRLEGGQMIIEHVTAQQPSAGVRPGAVADVTVTASRTYDGSGRLVESEDEELIQFVFFLAREGSTWKLDGIAFGAEEPP